MLQTNEHTTEFTIPLTIEFNNEKKSKDKEKWYFEDGLKSYLVESSEGSELVLEDSIVCSKKGDIQELEFAINWSQRILKNKLDETYVNLIPTPQGGSHLNGFKSGLLDSIKEFCDYRNLLPKGLKINADDVINSAIFIVSSKLQNPQFAGQTKERLDQGDFLPNLDPFLVDNPGNLEGLLASLCAPKRLTWYVKKSPRKQNLIEFSAGGYSQEYSGYAPPGRNAA